ncbi:two-component system response regulator RstA [Craterilacuibacter sinensis]|nr:two-component system response regulator RstA [Craterilacuibacter sinensis]RQW24145.1 two-component system response regulator RstA [Rhodobacteraceae bacterium CH30]
MPYSILFVEDDAELAELIASFLARHDLNVQIEARGDTALAAIAAAQPDLVLLDIMLPGKDGLSICRELRPVFDGPIVLLTSLDSDINQIMGLELGANDYILKTTPPSVLLARLRNHLRHARGSTASTPAPSGSPGHRRLGFGQLLIDPLSRDVRLDGHSIVLSTSEFDLLLQLAQHAGSPLSRETLLQATRGVGYDGLDRSIDVAISRLRKKLGDNPDEPFRIKTVRNKGYLFVPSSW